VRRLRASFFRYQVGSEQAMNDRSYRLDNKLPLISFVDPTASSLFYQSLKAFGFATLVDHPIDMERVDRIYSQWKTYFGEAPDPAMLMDPLHQDGYFSTEVAESAKGETVRDFKEYFQFYPWGRCPISLRDDLVAHYQQCSDFAALLLRWVSKHLPDSISDAFSEPLDSMIEGSQQTMLRVLHYPPVTVDEDLPRAAAHEDINLLTILPASSGPGLELQTNEGSWIDVPNHPNQVVVNIGDMLQEATGGFLTSTTHRVSTPTASQLADSRMSLPLFLHARSDVQLSERYSAGAYLGERLAELGIN
jgi:isopenicillin N synthase-like dioxygenase